MKKRFAGFLVFLFLMCCGSLPAFAVIPGEDTAAVGSLLTYGQIQDLLEVYMEENQLEMQIGSVEFYQYAWEQVYIEANHSLKAHLRIFKLMHI